MTMHYTLKDLREMRRKATNAEQLAAIDQAIAEAEAQEREFRGKN